MMKLPDKHPKRPLILAASAFSAFMLGFALVAQYGFDLHPCHLCIYQRIPYAIIIPVGLLTAFFVRSHKALYLLFDLCLLLLLADAGIAFYHAGVEAGIFPGPSGCTNTETGGETLEQMRAAIMNAALVPCDQPMAKVLGLSMAAWNGIAATFAAIGLFGAWRCRKKKMV